MSREARFLKDNGCYYIRSVGYRHQKIFRADQDYKNYVRLIKKYKLRFESNIYGYCLLPTSVHLIIHPSNSNQLPLFMQGVHQSYAVYFNTRYSRAGKVWGQRYKSVILHNDYDLVECIKLVEFFPVSACETNTPVAYPWSSCSYRVLGYDSIIDTIPPVGSTLSEEN